MGTWSPSSYGNDDATEWAQGLEVCTDLSLIERTLDEVIDVGNEYLEGPLASQAIAGIEVLARLLGHWGERNSNTEVVDVWVEKVKLTPSAEILIKAEMVLQRILTDPSELLELWRESEHLKTWTSSVENLGARVRSSKPSLFKMWKAEMIRPVPRSELIYRIKRLLILLVILATIVFLTRFIS